MIYYRGFRWYLPWRVTRSGDWRFYKTFRNALRAQVKGF